MACIAQIRWKRRLTHGMHFMRHHVIYIIVFGVAERYQGIHLSPL
jgi:hypothetical protein